jgi:regulator of protease activity HflC (stomatin/prohibitin superfamily)
MLAVTKLAQTNLRNLIGDMQLDEALTSRDKINTELREILDDATDKWGVRVARVEIQRIDPPPDVMHSMHEQMKAERTRRAVVTQAEGERQAAITRAEGDKQAAVLRAEGDRQQRILRAEGEAGAIQRVAEAEKFRQETVAEGEAGAILSVYGAIHEGAPDTPLLTIKYLEALRAMADGRATKIVVPTELAGIAGSLTAVADLLGGNNNGAGGDGAEPPPTADAGARAAARAGRPAPPEPERAPRPPRVSPPPVSPPPD